jgi:hypothetical protein
MGNFPISTQNVDNCVENPHLTSREGSIYAGFNNLPIPEAKFKPFKINDLRKPLKYSGSLYAANSYKFLQRGISR